MAVQFADKALDEALSKGIKEMEGYQFYGRRYQFELGYLKALKDTQKHLHNLWGAGLEEPSGEKS